MRGGAPGTDELTRATPAQRRAVSEHCAHFAIKRATRALTRLYDEALAPTGLTIEQFTLLVAASIAGGATVTALAERLVMDRTTLSRNLRTLQRQGVVALRADPADRRARTVTVTPTGERLLGDAHPRWEAAQRAAAEVLDEAADVPATRTSAPR